MAMFPKEYIPDEDFLYFRVHKNNYSVKKKKFAASLFDPTPFTNDDGTVCENPDGVSTDWSKYANPKQTQKDPLKYGVGKLSVKEIREKKMGVEHDPLDYNQAHSLILNVPPRHQEQRDATKTLALLELFKWEILPPI